MKCLCGHKPARHSNGKGRCWSLKKGGCECEKYVPSHSEEQS